MIDVTLFDQAFAHEKTNSMTKGVTPKYINWCRDGKERKGYSFFTDTMIPQVRRVGHQRNIALLIEPRGINEGPYSFLDYDHFRAFFDYIFTTDYDVYQEYKSKGIDNIRWFSYAGTWLKPEDIQRYEKSKEISCTCSMKKALRGHQLRHEVISRFAENHNLGVYHSRDKYQDLDPYKDYRFCIICENTRGWFTEKLIHCLQTGTIPIYWGLPNSTLNKWFDTRGILEFSDLTELDIILEDIKDGVIKYEDLYQAMTHNFDIASDITCPDDSLYLDNKELFE